MSKSLIIVESPTKAKTIGKFLGKGFVVKASFGHVRDLPNSASEIPARIKKEPWAKLGINVDEDFKPLYIVPADKKKHVSELQKALDEANEVYLATDEDREGESISWHLLDVLKPKVPVKRLVFHEITESAIGEALRSPRAIDENLVKAQETRRVIDRLFGYLVSPILWKKMKPRLSAGRVQSVALRLLVERERERMQFRSAAYWGISGLFGAKAGKFEADLSHVEGKRVAEGRDFDPKTGKLSDPNAVVYLDEEGAARLKAELQRESAVVRKVEQKPFTSRPYPPFTTSTLQQEASRKLGFSVRRTMQVAQTLYENGFITYMRTDSTNLSEEAISAARSFILSDYGKQFLPDSPRHYKTKVKNAQEAHEAIRPAGSRFESIDSVRAKMGAEPAKLYELIWKRMVACQMKDAEGTHVSVQVVLGRGLFRSSGKTISFPGFLRAYVEGSDDPEADLADKERMLPPLAEGDVLSTDKLDATRHETKAPPRFTEGSLIKELERLGIGRPSTWATIVDVVLSRDYAFKRGQQLIPTFLAMAVTRLMERFFEGVVDYTYTAGLEEDLDAISRGEADNISYLKDFYAGDKPGLDSLVRHGEEVIDPRDVCGIDIGKGEDGGAIEVRIGRYGPFLTDGTHRCALPEGLAPDELSKEKAAELLSAAAHGPESLGDHPTSHKPIYLKAGRFGPYVQEGVAEGEEKPKMASLLPGMVPADVTLDIAIKLLSLPRTVGIDPASGGEIQAMNGRFGPYIKCGSESRSIPSGYSLLDLSLPEALEILAQPKTGGRQRAAPAAPLRELGVHPETKKPLVIKSGRYGPYVTDGDLNASLPRGADPAAFSVEEAVTLLAERAAKIEQDGGVKRKAPAKRSASASGAPKSAPKKKPATKVADQGVDKGTGKGKVEKKATKASKPTRAAASSSTAKKRDVAGAGSSAVSKKGKSGAK